MASMRRRQDDVTATTKPDAAVPPPSASEPVVSTGARPVAPQQKSARAWVPLATVLVLLVVVLVFILQNLKTVRVSFFAVDWRIPLALDLVFAAILGGVIVLAVMSLRDFQRRRVARRRGRGETTRPGGPA
jgi:uncharacterized integral membrane protein